MCNFDICRIEKLPMCAKKMDHIADYFYHTDMLHISKYQENLAQFDFENFIISLRTSDYLPLFYRQMECGIDLEKFTMLK